MRKKAFKKIRLKLHLHECAALAIWMQESSMPFLAKLKHQSIWVNSKKGTAFFARFINLDPKVRAYRPVDLDLKVLVSDLSLIKLQLKVPKLGTYRKKATKRAT